MVTAVVSDLHLGSRSSVVGTPAARDRLLEVLAGADRVVLLGDLLSLRSGRVADVLAVAAPFLDRLREVVGDAQVVLVPGNHDHQLAAPVLEPLRLCGPGSGLALEQVAPPGEEGVAGALAHRLSGVDLAIAYPGLWLRPDVYATHGHYLDCHMTVPRLECLFAAAVGAALGEVPAPHAGPGDYEAVLEPIYAFAYARAQRQGSGASRGLAARFVRRAKREGLAHVHEESDGSGGVATAGPSPRGGARRAVTGLAGLAALAALNRAGLGPFRPDVSPAAIGRAAVRAAAEVVSRLGVQAAHVVLGHTHRAGPLPGEEPWRTPAGATLVNAGCWVYEPALIGPDRTRDPYWPGGCVLVEDEGPPRLRTLLAEPALAAA